MPSSAVSVAARLAKALPVMRLGRAGCLLPSALDRDSLDFLDMIDGQADPSLSWTREAAGTGLLVLHWAPLGTEVAAGDPLRLMDALEYLADRVDALLPGAQAAVGAAVEADTAVQEDPHALRRVLSLHLRPDLATIGQRPPGSRFRSAPLAAAPLPRQIAPLGRPEVEDHRAVIPPRRPAA